MRAIMGIIKNQHGVYIARKKVPRGLEEAVAQVLVRDRERMTWLQRSLNTKDLRVANIRAKPVLMEFDQILEKAHRANKLPPRRAELSGREVAEMAAYHYAALLQEDEEVRRDGTGSEAIFRDVAAQLSSHAAVTSYDLAAKPRRFGLSDREFASTHQSIEIALEAAQTALARGDISFVEDEIGELLATFQINLDRASTTFRQLGMAVLGKQVTAFQAIQSRHRGEPIETPKVIEPSAEPQPSTGETLRAALDGWKRSKSRPSSTVAEFEHGVRRFIELHGDMPVAAITKRHVRLFREALQAVPVRRSGELRGAELPTLVEWLKKHPHTQTISSRTINKLLAGVGAVVAWGASNGLVPEDVPWSNPFARMLLEQEEPDREPWEIEELTRLFSSAVFTNRSRPNGGKGEAAFWLPLLGLFTGARLGELAPLTVSDFRTDEATGIQYVLIIDDEDLGARVKTSSSRRTIPVHPELLRLGIMDLVRERMQEGDRARLFPLLRKGPKGGYGEVWSKWFGRYIRRVGLNNKSRVFHSFRHGFKDALRAAGVSEDLNDALTGHSGGGVGRRYGAKEMTRRFGLTRLNDAVAAVRYPGLDLSHLHAQQERRDGER